MIHYIGYCAKVRDFGERHYTKETIKQMYNILSGRDNESMRVLYNRGHKSIGTVHACILKSDGIKLIVSTDVKITGLGLYVETSCNDNGIVTCHRVLEPRGYFDGIELSGCEAKEC